MSFEDDFKKLKDKIKSCGHTQRYDKRAAKKKWNPNAYDKS